MKKFTKSIKHINVKAGVNALVQMYKTDEYVRGAVHAGLCYFALDVIFEYIITPLIYRINGLDRDGHDL